MFKIIGGDKKEYGPVSATEILSWIREGRANAQTLAQSANGGDWRPLSSFPEFASAFSAAGSPPPIAPALNLGTQRPPNYLWQAIACTLCCCLPLGIPAIVYASQVDTKFAAGDLAGAEQSSKNARLWCWIAFGIGIAFSLGWSVFSMLSGLAFRI